MLNVLPSELVEVLYLAAKESIPRAAINSISMMLRGRQVEAGHGSGKFVVASVALRIPRVLDRAS